MISNYISLIRVKQWTKNLIVFSGLIFSENLFHPLQLEKSIAAFILFCFLSSSVYVINDICDLENDRQHPIKKQRPLPAGLISLKSAILFALCLDIFVFVSAYYLNAVFFKICVIYFVTFVTYSLFLKNVVILDVLIISCGFVMRAIAGAVVIEVRYSPWFMVCTFLLSLFLALAKRRHEIVLLNENATAHRKILEEYSTYFLDQMISVVTPSTIIAYTIYTLSPDAISPNLEYTVPFVVYGIFRYLYLVHQKGRGGRPELILLTDIPLLFNVMIWAALCVYIIYFLD
ncbi:MAG: decaprenyl-phosphate phosphoribosyltransferase [Candidatus Schekmanbacteria bacterium]|nr:MAG: decaprenyl-phosphate phosphoribosyltransferase [Candidatus Schekmanbacteria bacterium]